MNWFNRIAICCTLLATPWSASAEESALRSTVKTLSEKGALGQRQVRRFTVKRAQVAAETRARLLSRLALSPSSLPETGRADEAKAIGDGFLLQVSRAGTNAYYRRHHSGPGRPDVGARPSLAELEPRARGVLAGALAPFLRLGHGETLEAWKVTHEIEGTVGMDGRATNELVASTVTFTRLVDGVPILGPDSKVHVTHAADGTLIGFEFDWPELESVDEQATVAIAEVRARADLLSGPRGKQVKSRTLECGYFTQEEGGADVLQPACISSYRVLGANGEKAFVDVVPIAARISESASWQEARFLSAVGKK